MGERFRPAIGIFLNLTDDHLDRYADLDEYGATKAALFARSDAAGLGGAEPRRSLGAALPRRLGAG